MARNVRVYENQLALVMGKRDMERTSDALRKLCKILDMPRPIRQLSHLLCCVTERWGDDA